MTDVESLKDFEGKFGESAVFKTGKTTDCYVLIGAAFIGVLVALMYVRLRRLVDNDGETHY